MQRFPGLAQTILSHVDAIAGARTLRVGVVIHKGSASAVALLGTRHRVAVFGDRFLTLFRIWRRQRDAGLIVEARLEALPVAPGVFDVLVVARRLPKGLTPRDALLAFRKLVKPGGRVLWVHPYRTGLLQRLGRGRSRATGRSELCRVSMECGLARVGQRMVKEQRRHLALTFGTVRSGNFDWN